MKAWVKGIIAGAVIAAIGVAVLIVGLYLNGWNYEYGSADNFTINTAEYENKDITVIELDVDAGSVKTQFHDGENIIIDYPVSDRYITEINQTGNTLNLKGPHKKHWWQFIGWNFNEIPDIIVKLPKRTFDITVNLDAGSANLTAGSYGKVVLDVDAGTINVSEIECTSLNIKLDAGTIKANSVKCGIFDADLNAGTVNIGTTECSNFKCTVDAGTATFDKITSDYTELKLSAGKIVAKFTDEKFNYNVNTDVSAGSCNTETSYATVENAKTIKVKVSAGKAELYFNV